MVQNIIEKVAGGLNKICRLLLGIVMLALLLVLLLQIVSRFVAFMPIPWSQDMITFLLVCSVFLGAGAATANGKQIRLEFFIDRFPEKVTKTILCVADVISIAFLCVIFSQCMQMGAENITLKQGASLVPFGVYYYVVAFGCVVMIVNFIMLIANRIGSMKSGAEEKEENK